MNYGVIRDGIYIKYVSFNKAVLWKNREISICESMVIKFNDRVKQIVFVDRVKSEKWVADYEDVKKIWKLKKEGQEKQYYIPIEVFKKIKVAITGGKYETKFDRPNNLYTE